MAVLLTIDFIVTKEPGGKREKPLCWANLTLAWVTLAGVAES